MVVTKQLQLYRSFLMGGGQTKGQLLVLNYGIWPFPMDF